MPFLRPFYEELEILPQEVYRTLQELGVPLLPDTHLQGPVIRQREPAAPLPQEAILLQQQAAFKGVDHLEYTMDGPYSEGCDLRDATSNKQVPIICFLVYEVTDSASGPRERNSIAQSMNRLVSRDSTVLVPFFSVNGVLVPGFPRTLGDAKRLDGECQSFSEGRSNLNQVI